MQPDAPQHPAPATPNSAGSRRTVRIPSRQLPPGGQVVVRSEGRQIALFRLPSGALHAVDNQCPHEGYPLVQGTVKNCVLTCPWHNYKFRLDDGSCLMGDEAVRTYPVREMDRTIEVEIVEPPADREIAKYLRSLEEGLQENRMSQVARDTVRLLKLGMKPQEIAFEAACYDAERAEFGSTHALAVAVDILPYLERYRGVDAVHPLMQALELSGEPHVRRPKRPAPEPADPGPGPQAAGDRLSRLIEEEELVEAEALLRGALARGWDRDLVEPWLYRACARHFLGFGHPLIYQVKIFDLLDVVGWERAAEVLPAHLLRIINATREDLLPEWLWFRNCLEEVEPRFAELHRRQEGPAGSVDLEGFTETIVDGGREQAFHALTAALEASVPLPAIVNAMSVAASERLLRFDTRIDADPQVQDGWLDATHTLTYVNALRHAQERYAAPDVLRLFYYGVRFINNARPLDLPVAERLEIAGKGYRPAATTALEQLTRSTRDGRPQPALDGLFHYLEGGGEPAAVRRFCEDLALADTLTRPIVVAHLIKMCAAAFEEFEHLQQAGHRRRGHPLYALIRLAASPIRERNIARASHEAIRFVEHGKVPRSLT